MLASLLGSRFWITAYVCLALGLWLPGDYAWVQPAIPYMLGGILFFTCLRIPLGEVTGGLRDLGLLRRCMWMVAAKLAVIPMLSYAVTLLIAPAWAPGVALVMLMPAGMSSVALTDLHRGDRVLALFLILGTSLVAPLTVPLGMMCIHPGSSTDIGALARQAAYLIALLSAPFAAAQTVRALAPRLVERGMVWWGRLSILCLSSLAMVSSFANRAAWHDWTLLQMLPPLGLVCLASLTTLGLVLLLRRKLPAPALTAFACASLYMNNGLSIAYATKFHPGEAHVILPCVLMQVPMVAAVVLWGRWATPRATGNTKP